VLPYALSNAGSLEPYPPRSEAGLTPRGSLTTPTARPPFPGISRGSVSIASMGLLPFEASYVQWCANRMTSSRPLTRFAEPVFKLTCSLAPQGIAPPGAQSFSLEMDAAPVGFCTSLTLSSL